MAGCRVQAVLSLVIIVNLLLLAFSSVLHSTVDLGVLRSTNSDREGVVETMSVDVTKSSRKEPDIIPRISDSKVDAGDRQDSEFKRTRWGDIFSPDRKIAETFWKGKQPQNYSGKPDFVLGIPTIAREGEEYLSRTLHSLFDNLNGYSSVVVVIFVGDDNETVVDRISSAMKNNFSSEYDSGRIHVIHPPKGFYPDWKTELRQSFNDPFERVKWRSKQNVDQLYLMMYSYFLQPKYYLMLEDDILAASDYLARIYMDAESKADVNYILISYCQLGAIGKLFRRELLPSFAAYLGLFWADKPLDWLLLDYARTRTCGLDEKEGDCKKHIFDHELVYKPSLFQHIGTRSSFPGKIQKLKDKSFKP